MAVVAGVVLVRGRGAARSKNALCPRFVVGIRLGLSLFLNVVRILLTSMVTLFRLRKISLYLFGAYLALGVLGSVWYALTPEHELYFDVRVTSFGGVPVALAVLLYMLRLKKRRCLRNGESEPTKQA